MHLDMGCTDSCAELKACERTCEQKAVEVPMCMVSLVAARAKGQTRAIRICSPGVCGNSGEGSNATHNN